MVKCMHFSVSFSQSLVLEDHTFRKIRVLSASMGTVAGGRGESYTLYNSNSSITIHSTSSNSTNVKTLARKLT